MGSIKVNTEAVCRAADKIDNINKKIKSEFSDVEKELKRINSYWDGSASDHAINELHEIINKFNPARYKVMNTYVLFMHSQIDDGYVQTERDNTSLAEAFK